MEKSGILFSSNVQASVRVNVQEILGITRSFEEEAYLGMPLMFGKNKTRTFRSIIDKVRSKVNGWSNNFLSQSGRAVLIQSVAQAIPSFIMHCFKLPKTTLHEMESILANFWWGQKGTHKKIHWKKWISLCISKLDGGMGFKDLESYNRALLARQWWRLVQNPSSMCYKILKAKYFPHTSPMAVKGTGQSSFLWQSLLEGKKVVETGARWRVGDGKSIEVWKDQWIKKEPTFRPRLPAAEPTPLKVSELIKEDRTWDTNRVKETFVESDAECILRIPLSRNAIPDRLIWNSSESGEMNAKAAYVVAQGIVGRDLPDRSQRKPVWRILWTAKVLPRIKLFCWRTVHGILPTGANLNGRHLAVENVCCICGLHGETGIHIFFRCIMSRQVWQDICPEILNWNFIDEQVFWDKALELWKEADKVEDGLITCWLLWNNRNSCFHDKSCKTPSSIVSTAVAMKSEFMEANYHQHILRPNVECNWKPPPVNVVKANVDAAFQMDTGRASLGIVFRNSLGQVEASALMKNRHADSPLHAELQAILFGIQTAKELSFQRIIIESDSLLAIKEIKKQEDSMSEWCSLIKDIYDLSTSFLNCDFHSVRRECNSLADAIAKSNSMDGNYGIWRFSLPPNICNRDIFV